MKYLKSRSKNYHNPSNQVISPGSVTIDSSGVVYSGDNNQATHSNRSKLLGHKIFQLPTAAVVTVLIGIVGTSLLVISHAATVPTNCIPNPHTCGYPDTTNTGVPAGTSLKAISTANAPVGTTWYPNEQKLEVTSNGAIIDGYDITGGIKVSANNVTIKNSRVHSTGDWGIELYEGLAKGTIIQDTEIDGMGQAQAAIVAGGGYYTATRINAHSSEDGLRLGDNITIQDSYIHDLASRSADPHYDGMQSGGGSNDRIIHNTVITKDNGNIFLKTDFPDPIDNTLIENNLLDGAGPGNDEIHFNILPGDGGQGVGYPTHLQIRNNRIGRNYVYAVVGDDGSGTSTMTSCGNIWDNNAQLVDTNNIPGNTKACDGTIPAPTPPPAPADTTPPTVPAGLTATTSSPTSVSLKWTTATDNVGVTKYIVKRSGNTIATLGNVTTYTDSTVAASTTYSYTVAAADTAGNTSADSTAAAVTTPAVPTPTPTPIPTPTPPPAASLLLGSNSIQVDRDNVTSGQSEAFKAKATTTGSTKSLSLYLDSSSAAQSIKVGIYSDASGHPRTLLAQATISAPKSGAWNTIALPSTKLTGGTSYWIAVLSPSGNGTIQYRDKLGGTSHSETSYQRTLTALPSTWKTGNGYPDGPLSAYVSL